MLSAARLRRTPSKSACLQAARRCITTTQEPSSSTPGHFEDYRNTEPVVSSRSPQWQAIRQAQPFSDFLTDNHNRQHDYLRISLTERCNLRCLYCMPEEGVELSPNRDILTTPEIHYLSKVFVDQGVTKIRLTGGEPTVRKDILSLMRKIGDLRRNGLKELALTTNGLSLHRKLDHMVESGLTGVNISLDTLDPFQYQILTRRQGFSAVMKSIDRVKEMNKLGAGIKLKINCVMMRGLNDHQLLPFVEMTRDEDLEVRFIEYMPFGGNKWSKNKMMSYADMLAVIHQTYPALTRMKDARNDTSKTWHVPGFAGRVGFITSMTHNFCGTCNRLRITSDGNLKVCLHGNTEVSLRDMLRKDNAGEPMDDAAFEAVSQQEARNTHKQEQLLEVIGAAVKRKQAKHAGMGFDARLIDPVNSDPPTSSRPTLTSVADERRLYQSASLSRAPSRATASRLVPAYMLSQSSQVSCQRLYSTEPDPSSTFQSLKDLFPKSPDPNRFEPAGGHAYRSTPEQHHRPRLEQDFTMVEPSRPDLAQRAGGTGSVGAEYHGDDSGERAERDHSPSKSASQYEETLPTQPAEHDSTGSDGGQFGITQDQHKPKMTGSMKYSSSTQAATSSPEQPKQPVPAWGLSDAGLHVSYPISLKQQSLDQARQDRTPRSSRDTTSGKSRYYDIAVEHVPRTTRGASQTSKDNSSVPHDAGEASDTASGMSHATRSTKSGSGVEQAQVYVSLDSTGASKRISGTRRVSLDATGVPNTTSGADHAAMAATASAYSMRRAVKEAPDESRLSLTHIKSSGEAHMVDVGDKPATKRIAMASAYVYTSLKALSLILQDKNKKGDVLGVARVAGIMAAKRTSDLIPLCHPIPITSVEVELLPSTLMADRPATQSFIIIVARVECVGSTGVEMEALTACSVAALTIIDMCKAVDNMMRFRVNGVAYKSGGRSGTFVRRPHLWASKRWLDVTNLTVPDEVAQAFDKWPGDGAATTP